MKDRATFTTWRWWQKGRNIQGLENSNLTAIREKKGIKSRSQADRSETLTRTCSGSSVLSCLQAVQPTSTVGSCVSASALCVSIPPSICLSLRSIACVSCGSLLCMLKAQLGSQKPLDWCSVASVFQRNDHLVREQRRWVRGSAFASSGGGYSGYCDSWEVEVKWNNQRTDRAHLCWICLSVPLCFLTLSVLKPVLQLSVDELAALRAPRAHRGHPAASRGFHPFWRAVAPSHPLCQRVWTVSLAPPSRSPLSQQMPDWLVFCGPPQRALLTLSSLTSVLHTFLLAGWGTWTWTVFQETTRRTFQSRNIGIK